MCVPYRESDSTLSGYLSINIIASMLQISWLFSSVECSHRQKEHYCMTYVYISESHDTTYIYVFLCMEDYYIFKIIYFMAQI